MNAQLKANESARHGLERVLRGHIERALANMTDAKNTAGLHGVRKEIKKMRAVFRLVRGGMRSNDYRQTLNAMRLAAKPLAPPRDALVTQKAFAAVTGRKARKFRSIQTALKSNAEHQEKSFKDHAVAEVARQILQDLSAQAEHLKIKGTKWAKIEARLEKSYREGRAACRAASMESAPEHLHEWRKQVKNLWYQLEFLCPHWPAKTKKLTRDLEKLGEQLGDDHDLLLLKQFAAKQGGDTKEAARLGQLIDERRTQYTQGILQLGTEVFAPKPKELCTQLKRDWKRWRKTG